ncbi:MAG: gamma-glutamylcyclotransferase, partial [Bacteroidota bacterium]|nr:gamma-glutamylcyclotransferase [Bacteroidota bacterium]
YEIKDEEEFVWALAQLDDYEGLNVEIGEDALYKRELVTVFINDKTEQAWIYWFAGSVEGKPIVANGDMLEYLYQKNK